jgi:hypothetical protein
MTTCNYISVLFWILCGLFISCLYIPTESRVRTPCIYPAANGRLLAYTEVVNWLNHVLFLLRLSLNARIGGHVPFLRHANLMVLSNPIEPVGVAEVLFQLYIG